MAGLINIGFGNMVNTDKIISIISSDSAPAKRLIQRGKETEVTRNGKVGRCARWMNMGNGSIRPRKVGTSQDIIQKFFDVLVVISESEMAPAK